MKISELIEVLQDRLAMAGDQDVYVYNTEHNTFNEVDFIYEKWEFINKPEGY